MAPAPAEGMAGDELISTPLTLPKGAIGVDARFEILRLTTTVPPIPPATTPTTSSVTAEGIGVGAGYGISDKLEAGLTYFIQLNPNGSAAGPLDLYGAFSLMQGKLSLAAGADFMINLDNTDSKALSAGVAVRYLVAPKISIFSGNPIPPGPAGQQLSIGLQSNGPITLSLPVGVGFQAAPKAFVYLDTQLARFNISNSANAFLFADNIPIDLGLLYRIAPAIDVGAHFADDLKAAGDAYVFGVLFRYVKH